MCLLKKILLYYDKQLRKEKEKKIVLKFGRPTLTF